MANPGDQTLHDADGPYDGSRALENLVQGVAHDVHNLTTAIRTSVETLRHLEDTATPELREAQWARIERAAEQASSLMSALASFGGREVQIGPASIENAVTDAAQLLRRALRVEIDVESPRAIAGSTPDRLVELDLARLLRALIQLCARAARQEARIHLAATGERDISIELRARDGEKPDVAPLDRDVERARALLEQIGASLPLADADGRSSWTGSLRLASAPAARAAAPPHEGRGAAKRRGRALIAEDHSQVRDVLIDALSLCGFSVEAVGDGDAFVDRGIASAGEHDVFLVDFDLPGRDGAKALEALREAGIQTPALMISGNIDFRPKAEALAHTDFMQKPFGLADIRAWATSQLAEPGAATGAPPR